MTSKHLPDDIRRFILALPSVPYLETILVMRESSQQEWTSRDVAQRLFLNEEKIIVILKDLCNSGVCESLPAKNNTFVYHPQSEDLAQLIARVAQYYARNLIEVTHMIHNNSNSQRIQQFADAFHWRKGRER